MKVLHEAFPGPIGTHDLAQSALKIITKFTKEE